MQCNASRIAAIWVDVRAAGAPLAPAVAAQLRTLRRIESSAGQSRCASSCGCMRLAQSMQRPCCAAWRCAHPPRDINGYIGKAYALLHTPRVLVRPRSRRVPLTVAMPDGGKNCSRSSNPSTIRSAMVAGTNKPGATADGTAPLPLVHNSQLGRACAISMHVLASATVAPSLGRAQVLWRRVAGCSRLPLAT